MGKQTNIAKQLSRASAAASVGAGVPEAEHVVERIAVALNAVDEAWNGLGMDDGKKCEERGRGKGGREM